VTDVERAVGERQRGRDEKVAAWAH
jgi:hypothetical protein